MKFADLIQFEPINEVVKFDRLTDNEYRKALVRNFVFSDAYEKSIIPAICRNLDYTTTAETFGLQIVGSYGTGKSHLMSLFSLIAEDASYLDLVNSDAAKAELGKIAGKYKIIRFELGNDQELWDIICYRIDEGLKKLGVDYSIAADKSMRSYGEKIAMMMGYFEQKYPNHGLMIVIDEMLAYLKGRSGADSLNRDLSVLQGLGQSSDKSKFRMVFGVQELIYTASEFQFAASMLQKVNDRFKDLTITKQDLEFVTSHRLLKKDDAQRAKIREHLSKFTSFFTEISKDLDKYVELFPVNPAYFDNFQRIRVAKSQREVLKTLSAKFEAIKNNEVPTKEPGLISYDSYWEDMDASSDMKTDPDVRRVSEIMGTIYQKIDDNFRDARAKKAPLARRIAGACAIKILQDNLTQQNGVSAETLVDDLCYLDEMCFDRDFLKDVIETTANQIVTATIGQYFVKNDQNQEFHLRVVGGVNYEQKIKDYAATTLTDDVCDSYWFNFLVEYLPIEVGQYRTGFKIYAHTIEWHSHKMMLDGYIFFGNPDQRSTTHPEQNFYIYFMPIFNQKNIVQKDEADSIYIRMESVSDDMKNLIRLYAAAESLKASQPTSEKDFYNQFSKKWLDQLRKMFDNEFTQALRVYYQGKQQNLTPAQLTGLSKESVISNIASMLLEEHFNAVLKDYPKFSLLMQPLSPTNQDAILKGARQKIANWNLSNKNGEAILAGLGLMDENQLSIDTSIYARSILQKLTEKGDGKVLNRDEILVRFWEGIYRSADFGIDSSFEFIVLCAMVQMGEIEIEFGGKTINALNLKDTIDIAKDATFNFSYIRRPKGLNIAAVKELFLGIVGQDLSAQLDNQEVYSRLLVEASALATRIVTLQSKIRNGISIADFDIIDQMSADRIIHSLDAVKGVCDLAANYGSKAKMRNLQWSATELKQIFEAKANMSKIEHAIEVRDELKQRIDYLKQAIQYVDDAFASEINTALKKIGDVVAKGTDTALNAYKAELDNLIDKYIDWYIAEYERVTINEFENNEKQRINASDAKRVAEQAYKEDFLQIESQFIAWEKKMSQLSPKSAMVNRQYLKNTPYQGFDPRNFKGFVKPELGQLKDDIQNIYNAIDNTLHITLQDQNLLENAKDALSDSEQKFVDKYQNQQTAPDNVLKVIEIIHKLHAGIRKITITHDDIVEAIGGLVTPADAIKAFERLIKSRTAGADGDNVRIIIS